MWGGSGVCWASKSPEAKASDALDIITGPFLWVQGNESGGLKVKVLRNVSPWVLYRHCQFWLGCFFHDLSVPLFLKMKRTFSKLLEWGFLTRDIQNALSYLRLSESLVRNLTWTSQFSHSVMSDSLRPHGLQHAWFPCPSPTPGACSNSCPSSWWCHSTISSSVVPFSSCLQSFLASRTFPMSQVFASGDQSIGASSSVLPMNIQDWFPLGLTGLISFSPRDSQGSSRKVMAFNSMRSEGPMLETLSQYVLCISSPG